MATPIVNPDLGSSSDTLGQTGNINFSGLIPQILEKFVAVLEAAFIIIVGVYCIRLIKNYLNKIEVTHTEQRNAINLLEKITSGFIIVISITIALKLVGIDMTLLVSVAILGLSYGLQDIIKNYVAGILILFKAPFKIGDTVKIREFTGKVHKMDFQATTLMTFDNKQVTIYNSDVMTQSIVNFSNLAISPMRRFDIDVLLGYGTDISKALSVFKKIIENHPKILKNPGHSIIFKKFNDSNIQFTAKAWIQKPCNILQIKSQIGLEMAKAFDEEKIYMPYTKDIQYENDYTNNEERKKRTNTFFQQPIFAAEVASESTANPEQPAEEPIDFDEPE